MFFINFTKFSGKHLYRNLFFNKVTGWKAANPVDNPAENLIERFSYDLRNFKNIFFTKHLRTTTSVFLHVKYHNIAWKLPMLIIRAKHLTRTFVYLCYSFLDSWGQRCYVYPAGIYLFKVSYGSTRKMYEIRWNLTIKTPKRFQWYHLDVFVVGFNRLNLICWCFHCLLWTSTYQLGNMLHVLAITCGVRHNETWSKLFKFWIFPYIVATSAIK